MKKIRTGFDRALRLAQLMTAGAAIGLYVVKAFGFADLDITPLAETLGAGGGAVAVLALKVLHFV